MLHLITAALTVGVVFAQISQDDLTIVGTWSSKSNQVFTGPGFYDPVDELLIEPALPGISYSFTDDGWFEEATYQVAGNAQQHNCPSASLIFQHGKYQILQNGTLILTPIQVDGRQLLSRPCVDNGVSQYSRYYQPEVYKSFSVQVDDYHGQISLQLYAFDGSPVQPLYLAFRPPLMLPTETLNPTSGTAAPTVNPATNTDDATPTASATKTANARRRAKRHLENMGRTNAVKTQPYDFTSLTHASFVAMFVGAAIFLFVAQ